MTRWAMAQLLPHLDSAGFVAADAVDYRIAHAQAQKGFVNSSPYTALQYYKCLQKVPGDPRWSASCLPSAMTAPALEGMPCMGSLGAVSRFVIGTMPLVVRSAAGGFVVVYRIT